MKGTRNVTAAQTASGEAAHGARSLSLFLFFPLLSFSPPLSSYAFVHFCRCTCTIRKPDSLFLFLITFCGRARCDTLDIKLFAERFARWSLPTDFYITNASLYVRKFPKSIDNVRPCDLSLSRRPLRHSDSRRGERRKLNRAIQSRRNSCLRPLPRAEHDLRLRAVQFQVQTRSLACTRARSDRYRHGNTGVSN